MLKKLMNNKKMLVILISVGLISLFISISILDAYVFRPGKPDYVTEEQITKYSKEKKEETKENEKVSTEDENMFQATKDDLFISTSKPHMNSIGGVMKFEPINKEYVDVVLENKEFEFTETEAKYPNVEPREDIPGYHTRYIDKMTNSSFIVNAGLEVRYMNDSDIAGIYSFNYPDQVRPAMQVWVFTKELLASQKVSCIYEIVDNILPKIVGENLQPVQYYRVNNSHIMFRGQKDDRHIYAGVEDANGNVFIFVSYVSGLEPAVSAANFESFNTAGFRYIDQEKRDQIYYDIINRVSMK